MPLPKPGKGTDKDKFISSCMGNSAMKKEFPDQKQRAAVCNSKWKKKESVVKTGITLKYSSPIKITESLDEDSGTIKISGIMLKASTTRNGMTYTIEEITKAKFSGKTISVDHTESATDNVGFFEQAPTHDGLDFNGVIHNTPYHPGIVEMIRKGLIKFVSIEAIADEVVKEGDQFIARGLDFTGLGLVKTPGCAEASFAIAEAFNGQTGDNMAEEEKPKDEEKKEEQETTEPTKETDEQFDAKVAKALKKIDEENKSKIEANKKESLIDETFKKVEAMEAELNKLKEKPSKGIVTDTPKDGIELVREKVDGKVNLYPKYPEKAY